MQDQPEGVSSAASVGETPCIPLSNGLGSSTVTNGAASAEETRENGQVTPGEGNIRAGDDARGTKRKRSASLKGGLETGRKPPSPPWAVFQPKNPTSFKDNGIRKSGRTNALPLELQPQGATRGKRAAYLQSHENKPDASGQTESHRRRHSRHLSGTQSSPKVKPTSSPSQHRSLVHIARKTRHSLPHQPSKEGYHHDKSNDTTSHNPHMARKLGRRSFGGVQARPGLSQTRGEAQSQASAEPARTLRLNFRRAAPPLLHPSSAIPKQKYASLEECFEQNEALTEDNERPYTSTQVRNEALLRQRLERAARPDGVLYESTWLLNDVPPQPEPEVRRTAQWYLCEHVKMFVKELNLEQSRHRREARQLAYEARDLWLKRQPKSTEYLLAVERKNNWSRFRAALKELQDQWNGALEYTKQQKRREYEEQQQRRLTQNLQDLVQVQTDATARRKRRRLSTSTESEQDTGYKSEESEQYNTRVENEGRESNDEVSDAGTSSTDPSESGSEKDDPYSDLAGEELRRKLYGDSESAFTDHRVEVPDIRQDEIQIDDGRDLQVTEVETPSAEDPQDETIARSAAPAAIVLDDVDEIMLDNDDESSTSEDETDQSDDEEHSSGDVANSDEEEEEDEEEDITVSSSLLGFFPRVVRKDIQTLPGSVEIDKGTVEAQASAVENRKGSFQDHADYEQVQTAGTKLEPTSVSEDTSYQGTSGHETPATTVGSKPSDLDKSPEYSPAEHEADPAVPPDSQDLQTPISSLLRGSLREYQHHGLDWLAGMYQSNTNGILADEMGLGKTIQTIALLAHLATEKEVWGPHLVVVPTSVMLNWEMEFKKWCPGFKILTYYGTQEERKEKRRGWTDDNRWNVCITSYQLALQDASSLKRRNWHFLVLDEAHNIKNFKSQRWQTLLTFKSQARLLLTGTPLQNNLTELWSLLFFLAPEADDTGESKFKDLKEFASMFKRPVEQILDHGREALDDQARDIIVKLHHVLRPHLLRRLKADVEKQMPKKYEHIVKCRLSKRQRQLYDGYMGLSGTRDSFASGNYMSIISCLMQLRKVCNHPDLFETRQIVTSYAMPRSAVADYEINELLVRRRLLKEERSDFVRSDILNLWRQNTPSLHERRVQQLAALGPLAKAYQLLHSKMDSDVNQDSNSSLTLGRAALDRRFQTSRFDALLNQHKQTRARVGFQPAYSIGLLGQMNFEKQPHLPNSKPKRRARLTEWHLNTSNVLQELFMLRPGESALTELAVRKFGCITPAVVAPGIARQALTDNGVDLVQSIHPIQAFNPFHESQTRLSIAFPDKSLIQYDCGKLQQLDKLLRQLQAGGHRALVFTQMTKVLDILEQFLNLHGHRYLRLDGSTKVESRQALTDQFNTDPRILVFILSSRSGGLGINLTGADTVIFYDLDWNPAMDKQCQDRCHRIGQTRDVHIYRFVSEGTIEANILRKSNQKRMLDDVVIQEGEFTTDAFYRSDEGQELNAEADAALDKVLGGSGGHGGMQKQEERALEEAEDKEDREAAREAQKEIVHTDDVDFHEKITTSATATPDAKYESPRPVDQMETTGSAADDEVEATHPDGSRPIGGIDDHFIAHMAWELADAVFVPMTEKQRKRAKKGRDASIRIRT